MCNVANLQIPGTMIISMCSSGYFIFISFCFVVYSIYPRIYVYTVVTYLFASAAYRDNEKSYPLFS